MNEIRITVSDDPGRMVKAGDWIVKDERGRLFSLPASVFDTMFERSVDE